LASSGKDGEATDLLRRQAGNGHWIDGSRDHGGHGGENYGFVLHFGFSERLDEKNGVLSVAIAHERLVRDSEE
jgi:hypothetical protein